jgi:hypothetical protein
MSTRRNISAMTGMAAMAMPALPAMPALILGLLLLNRP